MNLPNKITLTRILMIPVFVVIFYLDVIPYNHMIAGIIFAVAAATDFLDGYIARSRHLVTNLGKFLDPIADKVLVSTALILLLTRPEVFSVAGLEGWGLTVAGVCIAVILARELIVSGFRMIAAGQNLVLAADVTGKLKTFCQDTAITILLISSSLLSMTAGQVGTYVGIAFFYLCTFFTVYSGVGYIVKNRRVLKDGEKDGAKDEIQDEEAAQ